MSQVHLVPANRDDASDVLAAKIDALWDAADLASCFSSNDLTAIKLHVGEPGNATFVAPSVAAALVRRVGETGARPFLTDTVVLYRSPRDTGTGLTRVAHDHGFTLEATGAPFMAADGLTGADAREIPIEGGRHYERVAIATGILQARSLLVLTHATGHLGTGFGGALKNLGMGCSSKKAKLRQHHGQHTWIDGETCTACGTCAEWCPADAIVLESTATVDAETCIGCGECIAACQEGAVRFQWSTSGEELQERIVEHAAAVARDKAGRVAYVTVVMNVTKNCDCIGQVEKPLLPDIGILASRDPVAIDQAAHDLIRETAGRSLEDLSYPDRDGSAQMAYAEAMGLGNREFDLVRVEV
jgi:uncharacterized Fe-S center protein